MNGPYKIIRSEKHFYKMVMLTVCDEAMHDYFTCKGGYSSPYESYLRPGIVTHNPLLQPGVAGLISGARQINFNFFSNLFG